MYFVTIMAVFLAASCLWFWRPWQKAETCPSCGSRNVGRGGGRNSYRRSAQRAGGHQTPQELLVSIRAFTCRDCRHRWFHDEVAGDF